MCRCVTQPESHQSPEGGLGPCKTTNMLSDNLPHNITLATLARQRIAVCMVGLDHILWPRRAFAVVVGK